MLIYCLKLHSQILVFYFCMQLQNVFVCALRVSVCVCMCVKKFVLGVYMCTLLLTFSPNCRGN